MGVGTAAAIAGVAATVGSSVAQGVQASKAKKATQTTSSQYSPQQLAVQDILSRYLIQRMNMNRQRQTFGDFLLNGQRPNPLISPTPDESSLLGLLSPYQTVGTSPGLMGFLQSMGIGQGLGFGGNTGPGLPVGTTTLSGYSPTGTSR